MANRYPYDRDRYGRDQYARGPRDNFDRGGDEVRSWFGDDEAAHRRRLDERERDRWEPPRSTRWHGESAWADPRSYSSDRPYGDRPYASNAAEPFRETGWTERPDDYRREAPRGGWSEQDERWRRTTAMPTYTGVGHGHYAEPGHLGHEYDRYTYGRPHNEGRYDTREWSSAEGWRVPGPHMGRGPRAYQRSDERIHDEINERLTAHGLIDASDVECRVNNGEVTLSGFVDSRAAKRAAADLAEDIYGVRQVHNELRVRSHAADDGVGRTSVLGLTESQLQSTNSTAAQRADPGRPRTRS